MTKEEQEIVTTRIRELERQLKEWKDFNRELVIMRDDLVEHREPFCPFCYELGFDKVGLKKHFEHCKAFEETPSLESHFQ